MRARRLGQDLSNSLTTQGETRSTSIEFTGHLKKMVLNFSPSTTSTQNSVYEKSKAWAW